MGHSVNLFSRQNLPINLIRTGGVATIIGAGCIVAAAITLHMFAVPYILAGGAAFFLFSGFCLVEFGRHLEKLKIQEELRQERTQCDDFRNNLLNSRAELENVRQEEIAKNNRRRLRLEEQEQLKSRTLKSRLIRGAAASQEVIKNGYHSGLGAKPVGKYVGKLVSEAFEPISYENAALAIRTIKSSIQALGSGIKRDLKDLKYINPRVICHDLRHIEDLIQPLDENEFLDPIYYEILGDDWVTIDMQHYSVQSLRDHIVNCRNPEHPRPIEIPHNRHPMSPEMIFDLETDRWKTKDQYKDPAFAARLAIFKRNPTYISALKILHSLSSISPRSLIRSME